jgi:NAD(P)-dependent dehydrogenase (short-subunit alcohol dehydrogenase family)
MQQIFKGKTVLITGAGWGIGAATALLFAAYGAKVIVSDTSRKGGKNTLAKIKNQKGEATYIRADVSNQDGCEELIKKTIQTYGKIDIACNNSPVFNEIPRLEDGDMELYDSWEAINFASLNNCMQYEIEAMQKQSGGVIVNSVSIMGAMIVEPPNQYIDSKYGTLTSIQNNPGPYPTIHIHTIAPPFIATALLKDRLQRNIEREIRFFPRDMHGTIQEVARLILWLSSEETHLLSTLFNDTN